MLRLCDRLTRRDFLRLSALGLGLPAVTASASSASRPRARSVIQLFLWGGPAQQETFDLKPHAPDGIRSQFRPIATRTTGIRISEHLPRLAGLTDHYAIVRSFAHTGVNHGTSAYHVLTGRIHKAPGTLRHPEPDDQPSMGSIVTRLAPARPTVPSAVSMPSVVLDGDGGEVPGQGPGLLGTRYAPLRVIADPTRSDFSLESLSLPEGVTRPRLTGRRSLQRALDRLPSLAPDLDPLYERALRMLASDDTRRAFRLRDEPESVRDRYGWHPFAQSCLLARRLVEAGVPFITVYWNAPSNTDNQSWDTHHSEAMRLSQHVLPPYDRALSALLEDLQTRGLLEQTLVVSAGEFGRTPRINRAGGRDHWGFCQSILMAGAGVRGGQVYGASDAHAAYAAERPVRPDDLAATMLDVLGLPIDGHLHDAQNRPQAVCLGKPIAGLF
ncbi:MAG: DUF1501 domain-containing protein [Gemmataceae bacterium]